MERTFGTSMAPPAPPSSPPPSPGDQATLQTVDILVLVIYFVVVMAVGLWRSTVDGYFLAGKNMTWWPKRFGGRRIQLFISILYLFIYIFTKISVDMYAGAVFIQSALQWNLYLAVGLLLCITAVYTVAGGLAAVIYTDALQTGIMLAGALTLMVFSFAEVGGWAALLEGYASAVPSVRVPNSTCGLPRDDAFHLFRDPVTSDLPWPGIIIGMSVPSMWYWCSDQVIVQRSLAAKNLSHAKGGSLLAAYLKLLPFFIMLLPGMISRILYPEEVACADPEVCTQVSSTIFTMDVWRYLRPRASEWELMIVGRVFVLVLALASVLWIPVVQASQGGQLFIYIQSISTYLQPPVSVVFLTGCFWKRTNEKGAFWGLALGLLVGCVRMVLDFVYPAPQCSEADGRPAVVKDVHYLYFSTLLSFLTLALVVGISLATEKPRPEQVSRLTWFTRYDQAKTPPAGEQVFTVEGSVERREETAPPIGSHPHHGNSVGRTRNDSVSSSVTSVQSQSRLTAALYWLCGMERRRRGRPGETPPPASDPALLLQEGRRARLLVNCNLIACLSVAVFFIGYWA
ncbi:hypothetical protein CRUP_038643 [Coryphaenoides rupestris]|nr:hypothetical protein CRUP_038643 [Coryphaenoides rupestris]